MDSRRFLRTRPGIDRLGRHAHLEASPGHNAVVALQSVAQPTIAWSWSKALLGVAYAIPAAVVTWRDPAAGIPLALGVIVGVGVGLPPLRSQRRMMVLVGVISGVSLAIGSMVASWPVVAVATVFAVCLVASVTRWRHRLGPVVLSMGVPLVGAGLSETPASKGVGVALLLILGSVYTWLVSLAWPERPPPTPPPGAAAARAAAAQAPMSHLVDYGVRLGLAGAIAASIGFALGWDHPGWACCAALIVSRPDIELTKLRQQGRTISVLLGAILAVVVQAIGPTPVGMAALVVLVVSVASATQGSRWYFFPLFTTFLVISMLTLDDPAGTVYWLDERIAATLIGVGLSYVFMVLVPAVRERRRGEPVELALQ